MRRIIVFNSVSLDGCFVDTKGDMSWAHSNSNDAEWAAFVEGNARGEAVFLFGRITYDLMKSYWPTPLARERDPVVAQRMNAQQKIVFSRTLDKGSWNNTVVLKRDPAAEARKLKKENGADLVIMGSGTIVAQLTQARLIDEYQVVVVPIVLGGGRTMFDGVRDKVILKLTESRSFRNGNVVLSYEPASAGS